MKLEINYKKEKKKHTQRLNNMLLNKEWVNNKIKEEIKRGTNYHKNTTTPNPWKTAKLVLRGNSQQYRPTSRNKKNLK